MNVPYQTIYGQKGRTEFLLSSKTHGLDIRIECKWQQSNGSVDEKFPYLYLNSIEAIPENHIIIIADGKGFKPGAIPWLKNAIKEQKYTDNKNKDRKIDVMNLTEFLTWANNAF